MPTILGANSVSGYTISNSLRLNDNDTAYLNRTRSSQSNTTGTFSTWTKMGNPGADNVLFGGHTDVNNRGYIYFSSPAGYGGIFSRTSGSADIDFATSALYRDPSAWYHVVIAIDTTQGTEANRFKMYVNGEQISSFSASTYPSQNASLPILNKAAQTVGGGFGSSEISSMAEGYMADAYYIGGTQYAASDFGETDDNGVWIPKNFAGSFGTNGFKLEFQQTGTGTASASTIGADTSGNDNHLTSNNLAAPDVTTDTPTNNFSTFNPLANRISFETTFSEGNTDADFDDGNFGIALTTQAATNGKWYAEFKIIATGGTVEVGVANPTQTSNTTAANYRTYLQTGQKETDGTTRSSYGNTFTANDIISVAMDLDNGNIHFYKNGTIENSGTAAFTDLVSAMPTSGWCFYAFGFNDAQVQLNTGNSPFAISSGNSDGAGHGNFEYSVPSGYFALCTKNLAENG